MRYDRAEPITTARSSGAATLAKYLLLQIPGWVMAAAVLAGLVRWWELTPRLALLLFGLWLAKDFALYPVLRIAYEPHSGGGADDLVGALGIVQEDLAPGATGWIRMGAELWRAQLHGDVRQVLPGGATVRVAEVRELILVVEPSKAA